MGGSFLFKHGGCAIYFPGLCAFGERCLLCQPDPVKKASACFLASFKRSLYFPYFLRILFCPGFLPVQDFPERPLLNYTGLPSLGNPDQGYPGYSGGSRMQNRNHTRAFRGKAGGVRRCDPGYVRFYNRRISYRNYSINPGRDYDRDASFYPCFKVVLCTCRQPGNPRICPNEHNLSMEHCSTRLESIFLLEISLFVFIFFCVFNKQGMRINNFSEVVL